MSSKKERTPMSVLADICARLEGDAAGTSCSISAGQSTCRPNNSNASHNNNEEEMVDKSQTSPNTLTNGEAPAPASSPAPADLFGCMAAASSPPPANAGSSRGAGAESRAFLQKRFRYLLEYTVRKEDALLLAQSKDFRRFVALAKDTAASDFILAMVACGTVCNLCVYPDCRPHLNAQDLVALVGNVLRAFSTHKRIVHLALVTLTNVCVLPQFQIAQSDLRTVVTAVTPLYSEAPVVEAWVTAIEAMAMSSVTLSELIVAEGAAEIMQRLIVYHGGETRLVSRGTQCVLRLLNGYCSFPMPSVSVCDGTKGDGPAAPFPAEPTRR